MTNEEKVKKKFPDAVCEQEPGEPMYFISATSNGKKIDLGSGLSKGAAWTDAFTYLSHSKKMK